MGYPYNTLITPAILWKNPRITREELARRLNETHSSWIHEYKKGEPWDSFIPGLEDPEYHDGINGVAQILGIRPSREFGDFLDPEKQQRDKHGLQLRPPLLIYPERGRTNYLFFGHISNELGAPIKIEEQSWDKLKPGDIWHEPMNEEFQGIVEEVFEETETKTQEGENDDGYPDDGYLIPKWNYKMTIRLIIPKYDERNYGTEEELYADWPQFHPENVWEWDQREGCFNGASYFGSRNFLWKMKNGLYSLDERTFSKISGGFTTSLKFGLTDLVLTAGALKHKAWKLLSRRGADHLENFLREFPDVKEEYDKAIWDSHTSRHARKERMKINELLRARLGGRFPER